MFIRRRTLIVLVLWRYMALSYKSLRHLHGCSLGLEHLGLEAVSRRFLERIGLVSVSRVSKNRTSRSRLGLEGSMSRSRLGLEDITSRSRSRDFCLVNIHAMH